MIPLSEMVSKRLAKPFVPKLALVICAFCKVVFELTPAAVLELNVNPLFKLKLPPSLESEQPSPSLSKSILFGVPSPSVSLSTHVLSSKYTSFIQFPTPATDIPNILYFPNGVILFDISNL